MSERENESEAGRERREDGKGGGGREEGGKPPSGLGWGEEESSSLSLTFPPLLSLEHGSKQRGKSLARDTAKKKKEDR